MFFDKNFSYQIFKNWKWSFQIADTRELLIVFSNSNISHPPPSFRFCPPENKYMNLKPGCDNNKLLNVFLESLQNVRKHRTIQADKLRSFECSFLANYIGDFHHNRRKYNEQMSGLLKDHDTVERNNLWRASSSLKKWEVQIAKKKQIREGVFR